MITSTDIFYPTLEYEKSFLTSIWRLSACDLYNRRETILPKGTVEIIFNFSDNINYCNPSLHVSTKLPTVFINGINFKPFDLIKTGRQEFLGIQLGSAGLKLLFNISARELNNCVCEGGQICADLDAIADRLYLKHSFSEQVAIILNWIRKKIAFQQHQYSIDRVKQLIFLQSRYDLSVKKLCAEICLSDRQLRRFSQDWLGMSTEEYILYNKYLSALYLLHNSDSTLTDVGLQAGYYDQSHFIREFKSYTELTPGQYRQLRADFPGHIFM